MDAGKLASVSMQGALLTGKLAAFVMDSVQLVKKAQEDGRVDEEEVKQIHAKVDEVKDLIDEVLGIVHSARS